MSAALDEVNGHYISTVFLGLDHSFDFTGKSAPVLWETMVFKRTKPGVLGEVEMCKRYRSREDAQVGHVIAVEMARIGKGFEDPPEAHA